MQIYNKKNGSYLTKELLINSIFSAVDNKSSTELVNIEETEYKITGYRPNCDYDLKLFLSIIKHNTINLNITPTELIKSINPAKKRIQKRDIDTLVKHIKKLQKTFIEISNKNFDLSFNLIPFFYFDKEHNNININLNNSDLIKLYNQSRFIRFISIEEINKLNQYETSLYLICKSQVDVLYIREDDLVNKVFNNKLEDSQKKYRLKVMLNRLKELKLIRNYTLKNNTTYIIYNFKSKLSEDVELIAQANNISYSEAKSQLNFYKSKEKKKQQDKIKSLEDWEKNQPPLSLY